MFALNPLDTLKNLVLQFGFWWCFPMIEGIFALLKVSNTVDDLLLQFEQWSSCQKVQFVTFLKQLLNISKHLDTSRPVVISSNLFEGNRMTINRYLKRLCWLGVLKKVHRNRYLVEGIKLWEVWYATDSAVQRTPQGG